MHKIPIVALTAPARAEDRQKCLSTGCDDDPSKPIDKHSLLSQLSHALNRFARGDNRHLLRLLQLPPDELASSFI